jgi:hypothetical protein
MDAEGQAQVELPVFQLGAAGFSAREREVIAESLGRLPTSWPPWKLVPFAEADAWWICGRSVEPQPDGSINIAPGVANESALHLNLTSVDRPVAFSTPLAATEFEPRCLFSLDNEAGMHSALHMFGTWLQPVHAVYALGAMVMQRARTLRGTVHHLNYRGTMLAMLDYRTGRVGVLPTAEPQELWRAEWDKRPALAQEMPRNFIGYTPAQLLWAYVRRTARDLLPARYRTETVHYRHAPRVPLRWMRDSQLILLRELSAEPGTLAALRQRTGLPTDVIEHDLSCLYYTGAITTTLARSAARGQQPPAASQPSRPEHDFGLSHASMPDARDRTAPAPLAPGGEVDPRKN